MKDAEVTSNFISKVIKVWNMVNVHSYAQFSEFQHLSVVDCVEHLCLTAMSEFADMAERMIPKSQMRMKTITKDPSKAITYICNGLLDLSRYLFYEK